MKKILILVFSLIFSFSIQAQNKIYQKAYQIAAENLDYSTAINMMYLQIAEKPDDLALRDTLTQLYFSSGAYTQAIIQGTKILEKQPKNLTMMEILASSNQAMGRLKEALVYFEQLYTAKKSLNSLYQISVIQYQLQRVGECMGTINQIIADPNAEKEKIRININQMQQQEVFYKAAALNLKGILEKGLGKLDDAKKSFEEALKINPNFELPKGNIKALNEKNSGK